MTGAATNETPVDETAGAAEAWAFVKRHDGGFAPGDARPGDPVVSVYLVSRPVTDGDLPVLAGWRDCLKGLDLAHTEITDSGLAHLAALRNLYSLNLAHTEITDGGLAHLAALRNLGGLSLAHTRVTSKGLKDLLKLEQLVDIDLSGTSVAEDDLEQLQPLQKLRSVEPFGPKTTKAWLKPGQLTPTEWVTSEGRRISLRLLLPAKQDPSLVYAFAIYMEIRNDSGKPLRVVRPASEYLSPMWNCTVLDAAGRKLPVRGGRVYRDMGLSDYDIAPLEPGRRIRDCLYIGRGSFVGLLAAGRYKLSYTYSCPEYKDLWKGALTSAVVELELGDGTRPPQ